MEAPLPKPGHLGPEFAEQFSDEAVVRAYRCRPPYPRAVFERLAALQPASARDVLELGCGTGDLTLGLAELGRRVDAVEPSLPMLRAARGRREASRANVRFIEGTAESFPYQDHAGAYGLVVAAESLHWMDWEIVVPGIGRALAEEGWLALVLARRLTGLPWEDGLSELLPRHSTNRGYRPYDLVAELERRGLFACEGRVSTEPAPFEQSLDDYVESFHSRNGFSRDRMTREGAASFDHELRALVAPHCVTGRVAGEQVVDFAFGRPVARP